MHNLQTLREFMDRRLQPAMQTCAWAARRQQALSERISRVSNLLRTRVEIEQQISSQALLDAMNRRKDQLMQSKAFPVAAVTYYGAGLVATSCEGRQVDRPEHRPRPGDRAGDPADRARRVAGHPPLHRVAQAAAD